MKIAGLTDEGFVHTVIRRRPKDVHKGSCGKVLIVAGSREMAGAAVFSAKAAIKCGSGLVNVCTRRKIFPVIQISVPESICLPWGKSKGNLAGYDAIAVGPGMGVDRRTREILKRILTEYAGTCIIDADGLNTIAKDAKLQALLRSTKAEVVLPPHIGEAARLLGRQVKGCPKEEIGQALWEKYRCTVIVKGAATLVALSGGDAYINTTGNPGMATAGAGDVLTGIIVSLAGQGLSADNAARAGVFVHGMAGDMAAEKIGQHGLTASDIADYVPFALKEIID
ncbi:MAG: NAD(P)H-hydrate dehydratase [Emergencia sp.]|nr:NAD(P)H-hydrate dehydratase [Emergencia sp.]